MGEGYHPSYPSRVLRGARLLLPFLLLAAPRMEAASPVARLADEMAAEVLRVAGTRAVELAPAGEGATPGASDWRALLVERLAGRVRLAEQGPRVRVDWAVTDAPGRLVASARLIEEPGGRLLDIVSVSAPLDEGAVPLLPQRPPSARTTVDVLATSRSGLLEGVVLALAWISDERVLAVSRDEAALYRLAGAALVLESRRALPRPLSPVRSPGAIAIASDGAVWTLTSAASSAALLALDDGRLALRSRAEALPWSGSPTGLRFRPGTNLLELPDGKLGPGPLLALEPSGAAAVDGDGELRLAGSEGNPRAGLRVGAAVAALWQGLLAASSPAAPGDADAVLFVAVSDHVATVAETIPLEGAIRALASRVHAEGARLLAAVEEPGGRSRLVLMDLHRRGP